MQPSDERLEWEEKVYLDIEEILEITRSDAQGIVGANSAVLESAWAQSLTARAAALAIVSKNPPTGETP